MGRKKKIQISPPAAPKKYPDFESIENSVPQQLADEGLVYGLEPEKTMGYLGLRSRHLLNDFAYITLIRQGVTRNSLEHLMLRTGLSVHEMADFLETTDRTLRRYGADDKLTREQSERALEIAKLYTRGEEVFGDAETFKRWMDSNIRALGLQKPKSFLDTSLGIDLLLTILGRIEHGVYS
jgi:putative toxin-antitoxin system antitoxin component (TIGR02293 family)